MLAVPISRVVQRTLFCLAALLLASPAFGTSSSPDNIDIYNARTPNGLEIGWAVELVQSRSVVFATVFTYDSNMRPIWYSASLLAGVPPDSGGRLWIGDLYVTSGPPFGGPFDASKVSYRKVGQMIYLQQSQGGGIASMTSFICRHCNSP